MKGGRPLCWDKKEGRDGGERLEPNLWTRDRKENDDVNKSRGEGQEVEKQKAEKQRR